MTIKPFESQFKGTLSGLGQFMATKSALTMMKNAFNLALKAIFVLKIFVLTFWSCSKTA